MMENVRMHVCEQAGAVTHSCHWFHVVLLIGEDSKSAHMDKSNVQLKIFFAFANV